MPQRCLSAACLDVVSEHPLRATSFQQTHDNVPNDPQASLALIVIAVSCQGGVTVSGLPPRRSDRRSRPCRLAVPESVSTSSDRSWGVYRLL